MLPVGCPPPPPALVLDQPQEPLDLEHLKALLKQKVYSTTKGDRDLEEAPGSVTVIRSWEIEESGARTLADLLARLPGIQIQHDDKGDRLVWVRGVSHGDNERLLLVIDGIPKRETGASAWSPDERIDLHAVERVEVIRGPGSALYGGNAYAGIVSVFTRKAGGTRLTGEAGNQGAASLAFQSGQAVGDQWWSTAASVVRSDGWPSERGRSGAPTDNRTARSTRTLQTRVGAGGLSANLIHANHDYAYPLHDLGTKRESTYAYTMGSLAWEGPLRAWSFLGRVYGDHTRYGFRSEVRNANQTLKQEKLQKRHSLVQGFDAQAALSWGEASRLLVGANGEFNKATRLEEEWNPTSSDPAKRYFINSWLSQNGEGPGYNTARTKNFALFAQNEGEYAEGRLGLTLGLRWDRFEGFGSELSPRAGLVVKATETDTFKFLAGKAFRPPTLRQLFVRRSDGKQPGNPDLLPEQARTLEVEWLHRLGSAHSLRATLFRSRYTHTLLTVAEGPWQNGTTPRILGGLEGELKGNWAPDFLGLRSASATLHGTYLRETFESTPAGDVPLEYVARKAIHAGVALRWEHAHASASWNWIGRRNPGRVYDPALGRVVDTYHEGVGSAYPALKAQDNLGAFGILNLTLGWHLRRGWKVELLAHNLLDRLAFNPTYDPDTYYDVTRERRSVLLRVGLLR